MFLAVLLVLISALCVAHTNDLGDPPRPHDQPVKASESLDQHSTAQKPSLTAKDLATALKQPSVLFNKNPLFHEMITKPHGEEILALFLRDNRELARQVKKQLAVQFGTKVDPNKIYLLIQKFFPKQPITKEEKDWLSGGWKERMNKEGWKHARLLAGRVVDSSFVGSLQHVRAYKPDTFAIQMKGEQTYLRPTHRKKSRIEVVGTMSDEHARDDEGPGAFRESLQKEANDYKREHPRFIVNETGCSHFAADATRHLRGYGDGASCSRQGKSHVSRMKDLIASGHGEEQDATKRAEFDKLVQDADPARWKYTLPGEDNPTKFQKQLETTHRRMAAQFLPTNPQPIVRTRKVAIKRNRRAKQHVLNNAKRAIELGLLGSRSPETDRASPDDVPLAMRQDNQMQDSVEATTNTQSRRTALTTSPGMQRSRSDNTDVRALRAIPAGLFTQQPSRRSSQQTSRAASFALGNEEPEPLRSSIETHPYAEPAQA